MRRCAAILAAVKYLVTTSRMPCAVEEIRKLGHAGHEVHAADTFGAAPGNHSRWAHAHVTPSPRYDTAAYLEAIIELVYRCGIDMVLPAFEEVFYLQRNAKELHDRVEVFAPSFDTLHRLHDKVRFVELARELGVDVARTIVAHDQADLRHAITEIGEYFARPAYSRGGVYLLTNTGPLAGVVPIDACHPTATNPWLVQEFVHGRDLCTFSVVQHGRVVAHSTYVHPKTLDSAGGIVFESIVEPRTLELAQRFAEATGYHGQISFDFLDTPAGLIAVECNPRPTAGVTVMPDEMFVAALTRRPDGPTAVAPAGMRRHIWSALLRDMFFHPREIPSDLAEILSKADDVYAPPGDRMPGVYQFLSLSHVWKYRHDRGKAEKTRSDLMSGYFHDVSWDGDEIVEAAAKVAASA